MKRITILILALAGAMLLGGSAVFAAGQIARSSAIREKDARSFTYVDAGILPEEAEEVSSRFGFEKGRFVYEIEFTARGLRYKYVLDSGSGAVLEKEMETIITDVTGEVTGQSAAKMIGVEKAKKIALKDAGFSADAVVFTKARQEKEGGREIYDIEFYVPEDTEYEYEIDVYSGQILEKDAESIRPVPTEPEPTEPVPTEPAHTEPVPTEPVSTEPVPTEPVPTEPVSTEPVPTQPVAPEKIGVEKAKKIALKDAGFSADAVVFTKARQEKEGGREIYDIEFYVPEDTEYEYEIDAYSGQILEKDAESIRPVPTEPEPTEPVPTEPVPTEPVPTEPVSTEPVPTQPVAPEKIGVEKAKKIALKDAGRRADAVVFTKARQEKEGGREIYDIEFYVPEDMEYEYEIDVYSGQILEKDAESIRPVPTEPEPTEPVPTEPVPTEPVSTEPVPTQPVAPEMIGVEKAKKIALKDAGCGASEVTFEKVKLEKEDGKIIYEIEFFIRGKMEYEYEIDAYSGQILEKDAEEWDD